MTVRKLVASVPVITLLLFNCFGPLDPNDPYIDPGTGVTPNNIPGVQKGMVAYWKFNEGKESGALDMTSNKNTLIVNSCIWDSGVDSSALKFDGSSSYACAYNDSSLNFGTGDFTISLWIKPQKIILNQVVMISSQKVNSGRDSQFHYSATEYPHLWEALQL